MSSYDSMLEQIVGRVLDQLRSGAPAARAGSAGQRAASATRTQPSATQSCRLIGERVVTADLLEQMLNGEQRIAVVPGSVVTPSARDWLRSRGIEWAVESTSRDRSQTQSDSTWTAVFQQSSDSLKQALQDVSTTLPVDWQRPEASDAESAARAAVNALTVPNAGGVAVFTAEPAAAACMINRDPRARAAVVQDAMDVKRVKRELGANVFCLAVDGKPFFTLRNMLREICAGERPRAPDGWGETKRRDESGGCQCASPK